MLETVNNFLRRYPYTLIALAYWLIAGVIPLAVIFTEFKNNQLWWEYSKFYSPLFYYPLIFGFFAVYLSLRPIIFFLMLPRQYRFGLSIKKFLLLILIVSLFVFGIEVSQSPAIWEIKPHILANHPQAQKVINHFKNPPSDPSRQEYENPKEFKLEENQVKADREVFASILNQSVKKISNWSYTRWTYFVSFCIQVLALLILFWSISFFTIPRFRASFLSMATLTDTDNYLESFQKNLIHLSASLCLSFFWIVMRFGFEVDKLKLYGSSSVGTTIIAVAYLIAICSVSLNLIVLFKDVGQTILTFVSAIATAGITIQIWKTGVNYLGSQAQPQNYFMCLIGIVIISFPWWAAYRDTFR